MAILAGVVAVNVMDKPGAAKIAAANLQLKILKTSVQMYGTEQGAIPSLEQGLDALVKKPTREPVPERYPTDGYLDSLNLPEDPWNRPYIYLVPGRSGKSFEILTYGSDGEKGGEGEAADLSSSDS
jgi:general secretion pathway protein G